MENSGAVAEFRPRCPLPDWLHAPKCPDCTWSSRTSQRNVNKQTQNQCPVMTSITTGSLSNKWVITQGQTTGCCSCQRCWEVTTSSSSTVPSFFFFSLKILQSKFPFYCNELKVIVQFNSGVWCTMKCWRMEQRKHQNNSNSRSKVFVRCGHPKCIINTALSLATIYPPAPRGRSWLCSSADITTFTTVISEGKFIICCFFP